MGHPPFPEILRAIAGDPVSRSFAPRRQAADITAGAQAPPHPSVRQAPPTAFQRTLRAADFLGRVASPLYDVARQLPEAAGDVRQGNFGSAALGLGLAALPGPSPTQLNRQAARRLAVLDALRGGREGFSGRVWYHGTTPSGIAALDRHGNVSALPLGNTADRTVWITSDPATAARFARRGESTEIAVLLPEGRAARINDPSPESVRSSAQQDPEFAHRVTELDEARNMRFLGTLPIEYIDDPYAYFVTRAIRR